MKGNLAKKNRRGRRDSTNSANFESKTVGKRTFIRSRITSMEGTYDKPGMLRTRIQCRARALREPRSVMRHILNPFCVPLWASLDRNTLIAGEFSTVKRTRIPTRLGWSRKKSLTCGKLARKGNQGSKLSGGLGLAEMHHCTPSPSLKTTQSLRYEGGVRIRLNFIHHSSPRTRRRRNT